MQKKVLRLQRNYFFFKKTCFTKLKNDTALVFMKSFNIFCCCCFLLFHVKCYYNTRCFIIFAYRNGSVVVNFTLVFIRGNKSVDNLLQVLKESVDNGSVLAIPVERETLHLILPCELTLCILLISLLKQVVGPQQAMYETPSSQNISYMRIS